MKKIAQFVVEKIYEFNQFDIRASRSLPPRGTFWKQTLTGLANKDGELSKIKTLSRQSCDLHTVTRSWKFPISGIDPVSLPHLPVSFLKKKYYNLWHMLKYVPIGMPTTLSITAQLKLSNHLKNLIISLKTSLFLIHDELGPLYRFSWYYVLFD